MLAITGGNTLSPFAVRRLKQSNNTFSKDNG